MYSIMDTRFSVLDKKIGQTRVKIHPDHLPSKLKFIFFIHRLVKMKEKHSLFRESGNVEENPETGRFL